MWGLWSFKIYLTIYCPQYICTCISDWRNVVKLEWTRLYGQWSWRWNLFLQWFLHKSICSFKHVHWPARKVSFLFFILTNYKKNHNWSGTQESETKVKTHLLEFWSYWYIYVLICTTYALYMYIVSYVYQCKHCYFHLKPNLNIRGVARYSFNCRHQSAGGLGTAENPK